MRTRKILPPRLLKKSLLVPLVAGATAIIVATGASASPAPPAPRMSPATLANGILFDQGQAAGYLSSFFTHGLPHASGEARLEQAVDAAVTSSGAAATTFAQEIQSGNRIEVQGALNWLAQELYGSMTKLYGATTTGQLIARADAALTNTPAKGNGEDPNAVRSSVNVVYQVGQAVLYVQAAAIVESVVANAVVVLSLAVFFFSPYQPGPQTQLSAQEFVNAIAGHLKAA